MSAQARRRIDAGEQQTIARDVLADVWRGAVRRLDPLEWSISIDGRTVTGRGPANAVAAWDDVLGGGHRGAGAEYSGRVTVRLVEEEVAR